MTPELVPFYSAIISAVVALCVSWLSSRRAVRLEIDKLRLATQQVAFSKLLDVRIREYPALYAMLSDLPKAFHNTTTVDLEELLRRVNKWDSQHSIFLGPETSNICYAFRASLREAAGAENGGAVSPDVLEAAERLELALRSDIGIHGIAFAGSDLSPRPRERY